MVERRQLAGRSGGFTLLELMIVIAILGIILRMVLPAFGRDVPRAQVLGEARQLATRLSYLRSASQLEGRRYGLQIEAPKDGPHRYRIVMPREQQVVHDLVGESAAIPREMPLEWNDLPETVRFLGISVGRRDSTPASARKIFFDPRGRTNQKIIYLGHSVHEDIVYSVRVPPLTGRIETTKGRVEFPTAVDSDF